MRIRRTQTVFFVLFFLGFFAFSNYVLGFLGGIFNEAPAPVDKNGAGKAAYVDLESEVNRLENLKRKIEEQNKINDRLRGDVDAARKNVQSLGNGEKPKIADPPALVKPQQNQQNKDKQYDKKTLDEIKDESSKAKCKHTRMRDYEEDAIKIMGGGFSGRFKPCDIPCEGGGKPDATIGTKISSCEHAKSIFFTMENMEPSGGSYDIVANTRLSSDVPLPYFNWVEYHFKRPAVPKTAKAHVAAFISNCGPTKRLNWMKAMMDAGVTIDSYGSCMHNKDMPQDILHQYGADYNGAKMAVVSTYKFTMSFENSATDDYVTEKLFGVLVAGSVPLYDGAPNGKKFGPSAKSMLFADDYGTPEKMAERILYLDTHDDEYQEYLEWKKTGPTDDFTALMDIGNVHSSCRMCIRTADMHRREVGEVIPHKPEGEPEPTSGTARLLKVRERGKFWMRDIYLVERTLKELKEKLNTYVPHEKDAYLYSVYEYWSLKPITTDDDVIALKANDELEAVFVVHQDWSKLGLNG